MCTPFGSSLPVEICQRYLKCWKCRSRGCTQAKHLLRQCREEHESALETERLNARQALEGVVTEAGRDHRREVAAALSALSRKKDEDARRALAAKDVELREELQKASLAARDAIDAAEARAKSSAAEAEALAREMAEKGAAVTDGAAERIKAVEQKTALALAVAEEKSSKMKKSHDEEVQRLWSEMEATAAERDKLAVDRDAALAEASGQRRLVEEEKEAHEQALEETKMAFLRRQEELEAESREVLEREAQRAAAALAAAATTATATEAAAQDQREKLEAERDEARREVNKAIRRKDREMAKALKVRRMWFELPSRKTVLRRQKLSYYVAGCSFIALGSFFQHHAHVSQKLRPAI